MHDSTSVNATALRSTRCREDPDEHGRQAHREPERPSEQSLEHRRRADENRRDGSDHEQRPDHREERPDGDVVAPAQELRNRRHAGSPEQRHEEKRRDHHGERARDEIEVHHHDAVAIRVAGQPNHVLRADVGHDERHAGDPPRQRPAGEEVVAARPNAAAGPEANRGHGDEVDDDEDDVERGKLNRRHGGR